MREKLLFTLLISFYTLYGYGQMPGRKTENKIDSIFAKWKNLNAPGLAVAVLTDKSIIYSKGFGIANLEYNTPIKSNTVFDIASLSKQFTAFSIAMLVESGKISLDDDIREYIPELYDFGKKINIEHLLTHTSGLRDQNELLYLSGWKQDDIITNENILNLIFHQTELNFSPGEQFKYCNSGYTLLALIVERVTKIPFAEWTTENIFKPLKMKNTFFITNNKQLIKNRAYSYSSGELGYEKNLINSTTIGARGLQSTVEDLSLWVLNFTNKSIGSKFVFNKINSKSETLKVNYNFGQAFNTYNNLNLIEHDGSDAGFRTYIGRFPEHNISFIVLSNSSTINPRTVAMQIADILLFKKTAASTFQTKDKEKIEVPETVEKGMEGQFQISIDKLLTVWADDHALKGTINNEDKIYYLKPISKTQFVINELDALITYKTGIRQTADSIVYKTQNMISVLPKIFVEDEESKKLLEYEGEYYSEELGVGYKITKNKNTLKVELPRDSYISLKKDNRDNFTGSHYWFRRIKFIRNESSRLVGFELSTGRSYNIKYQKK